MTDDELLFAGMHDQIRRAYFLPDWMSHEEIDILFCHYMQDIDSLGYRYRVRPFSVENLFCIVDDHTDELYHHQRGSSKTRRIWTSRNVSEAILYAEQLSKQQVKLPKEETHISQVVRHMHAHRKTQERKASAPVMPSFRQCETCQRMVRGEHEC